LVVLGSCTTMKIQTTTNNKAAPMRLGPLCPFEVYSCPTDF
jgi:hypothetical protein